MAGGYGHTVGRSIALAYLPLEHAQDGTEVEVEISASAARRVSSSSRCTTRPASAYAADAKKFHSFHRHGTGCEVRSNVGGGGTGRTSPPRVEEEKMRPSEASACLTPAPTRVRRSQCLTFGR
jgi:hypothetical protein